MGVVLDPGAEQGVEGGGGGGVRCVGGGGGAGAGEGGEVDPGWWFIDQGWVGGGWGWGDGAGKGWGTRVRTGGQRLEQA